jgi:choline dehydrogenase-like flavoprotein
MNLKEYSFVIVGSGLSDAMTAERIATQLD